MNHPSAVRRVAALPQVRMALTGLAAQLIDVSTLMALAAAHRTSIGLAAVTGAFVGGTANFFMVRSWVFDARGPWLKQLFFYNLYVVAAGALLTGWIVHLAVNAGVAILVAKCVASIVTLVVWNYPVSAHVVFREEEST